MTLIMGLNLTDRVILAADTKVTSAGSKDVLGYCIKIFQFEDDEKNFFSCAFAGNKHFCKFIVLEIQKAVMSKELVMDINWLLKNIDQFLKRIIPLYTGLESHKEAMIIFAGVSTNPKILKPFDKDAFHSAFGSEGGRVEDENLIFAMHTNFMALPTREQKIFSYKISTKRSIIELGEIGGVYSFIFGGSTNIDEDTKWKIRKIFLDKRPVEDEVRDILLLIKSKYSDTIGGAVTVGIITGDGILRFIGYETQNMNEFSDKNWSVHFEKKIIGIDSVGHEYDLIEGFYDDMSIAPGMDLQL